MKKNLEKIKKLEEPRLIRIRQAPKIIVVGDTHGDLNASQIVISRYLKPGNKIIFLGDYVDRGPNSKKNIDFLLKQKIKNPNQIYLLQGNHEGYPSLRFSPADFWSGLGKKEYQFYSSIFKTFPLAVVIDKIIALHGALPDVNNLEEINEIELGTKEWQQIAWGDFIEKPGEVLSSGSFTGRPQLGRDYFLRKMKEFNKKILIRSHQPNCPQFLFDNRCLTIFTSSAYTQQRTIAILDLKKEIRTTKDLEIKRI